MQVNCIEDLAVFLNTPTVVPFKKIMTTAQSLLAKLKTAVFTGTVG